MGEVVSDECRVTSVEWREKPKEWDTFPWVFCNCVIPQGDKVVSFDTDLEVFILKGLGGEG